MTDSEAWALIVRHRAMKGKATPSEHMAYLWDRLQVKDLNAGQRGFMAAAIKPSGEVVE